MRKLNILNKLSKNAKKISAGIAVALLFAVPVTVFAGYGPNGGTRTIYDFANPAQREGAFDGPRFNSYINTNVYGDERAFLDTKECVTPGDSCYTQGAAGNYRDDNTVSADKEYIVRAYIHNIANPSINGTNNNGIGVATNTRFSIEIPAGIANGFSLVGRLSADNSIPTMVYDTADLRNNNQAFDVDYISGSARIFNDAHPNGLVLNDSIVTSGVQLGYNEMNGVFPGCFDFSAFVTIRVKIKAPALKFTKKVTTPGSADWRESITVKKGDTVSWLINYDNIGSTVLNNITIRDAIPAGLTLVPGSITWFDPNHPNGEAFQNTALGSGGVNVGNYSAGSGGAIRFRTIVTADEKVCEIKNVAVGKADNVSEISDDAKIVISDCKPTTPPTTLPRTGPADMIGVFMATTIAGAVAHRVASSRKFNQ